MELALEKAKLALQNEHFYNIAQETGMECQDEQIKRKRMQCLTDHLVPFKLDYLFATNTAKILPQEYVCQLCSDKKSRYIRICETEEEHIICLECYKTNLKSGECVGCPFCRISVYRFKNQYMQEVRVNDEIEYVFTGHPEYLYSQYNP